MRVVRRTSAVLVGALIALSVTTLPVEAQAQAAPGPTTFEVEGTVRAVVVDRFGDDATSDHRFTVVTDSGAEIPVDLPAETSANGRFEGELVVAGEVEDALDVRDLLPSAGSTIARDTRAGRVAVAEAGRQEVPLEVATSTVAPAAAAAATTPAAHRAYVAKMTDQGSVDGSDSAVLSTVRNSLQYWVDESGGAITSFEPVGALRSFDSDADIGPSDSCGMGDPDVIWAQAAALFPGVDFTAPGNHLIVVVGDECGDAGPIGVATVGSSIADGGLSMLTFDSAYLYSVSAHEIGHNFGLGHANLDGCDDTQDCEYLDLYSPMALAITGRTWYPPALGTLYRQQLGIATSDELAAVAPIAGEPTKPQSFALSPRGSSSGLRGLVVTDPVTGSTYSIDWRRPRNSRDDGTFYGSAYSLGAPDPLYPGGIVIERQGSDADGSPDGEIYLSTRVVAGRVTGSFGAGSSFSPSAGLTIGVVSTGNDSTGATSSVTVTLDGTATPVISSSTPTLSGSPVVGQTVTASPGSWTTGAELSYDWLVDGASTGATGPSYTVPRTAAGRGLTVAVTGSKSGYLPATRVSARSSIAPGTFAPGSVVSSAPLVGGVSTAVVASWPADAVLTYQWFADDVPVAGATSRSLSVPSALLGQHLRVVVTGSRQGYVPASASSAPTGVAAGRLTAGIPAISGTAKVGRTLKVTVGSWSPTPSFRYQWFANGRKISSRGTGSSFRLTSKQKGKRITVRVTGAKPGYATVAKTSRKTKAVARR